MGHAPPNYPIYPAGDARSHYPIPSRVLLKYFGKNPTSKLSKLIGITPHHTPVFPSMIYPNFCYKICTLFKRNALPKITTSIKYHTLI